MFIIHNTRHFGSSNKPKKGQSGKIKQSQEAGISHKLSAPRVMWLHPVGSLVSVSEGMIHPERFYTLEKHWWFLGILIS